MQSHTFRTTVDFEPSLYRLLREAALKEGKTIREILHEATRIYLRSGSKTSFDSIYKNMRKVAKIGRKINLVEFVRKDRDSHI